MADEKVSHERARVVLQRLGEEAAPCLLIEAATLHLYIKQNETIAAQLADAVEVLRSVREDDLSYHANRRIDAFLARLDAEKGG